MSVREEKHLKFMLSNEASTNFCVMLRHEYVRFLHYAPGFTVGSN